MKIIIAFVALVLSANGTAAADKAPIPRKVPCPAQCNANEEADSTQQCVQHDKELYKQDGIGCVRYEPVCWCKPKREKLPPVTKL